MTSLLSCGRTTWRPWETCSVITSIDCRAFSKPPPTWWCKRAPRTARRGVSEGSGDDPTSAAQGSDDAALGGYLAGSRGFALARSSPPPDRALTGRLPFLSGTRSADRLRDPRGAGGGYPAKRFRVGRASRRRPLPHLS